jgi:type I restriction enzyme M protein
MIEKSQSLALTDIANYAEVGVSAVSNWRKRHADFPQPFEISGQELFAIEEVVRWLSHRKIARNSLHSREVPGTTYGDRFIRNGGISAPSSKAEPSYAHEEVRADWINQLWQIMDLLRSDFEPVSALDFIMALLYLRITNQELWRMTAEQRSWAAVSRMLRDVSVRADNVPLFPTVTPNLSGGQQLVEAIRLFDDIDLESVGAASIFDALLERSNRNLGRQGGHFTPPSVVKCMVELLDPRSTNTVYDPSCGSGELLVAAAQHGAESLFGQAMNGRSLRMTLLNLSMHGSEADLRIGGPEILHGAFPAEQFDIVLSNPPFSITLPDDVEQDAWPFEAPTKRASNFAWLQLAVHKLRPGGRAGILMPNGTLFASGVSAEIRRKMIDDGVVEGIIAFPAGLFADTGIPVSLWLVRRPKPDEPNPPVVLFIDATTMGVANERPQRVLREEEIAKIAHEYRHWRGFGYSGKSVNSPGFARSVGIEEIRQNDYNFQPRRYVGVEIDRRYAPVDMLSVNIELLQRDLDELTEQAKRTRRNVDAHLKELQDSTAEEWRKVPLGDICRIHAGPGAVDRQRGRTVQGWTPLVLPRNIKRGYLSHDELDTVSPEIAEKFGNYGLQPGDIVCARSGTLGRYGLVRGAENGWLLGPSCMRLRPVNSEVVPAYLVLYLNSPEVGRWITSESRGSTAIPHINAATMRELLIPIPPVSMQQQIVTVMELINTHLEQHQQGASMMQSLRDLVFPTLMQS